MGNVRVVDAIIIVVYFAVMAVMGIIAYRRNKTSEDFFVAGKSMGTFSLAAMWLSSWIGGSSIVGTSTDAYNLGVTGGWYVTILAVGCVVFGLTFSKVTKTLGDKLKNLPNQLSGGQQQRVSIARALVRNPAVILADEPTGALDSHTGREVIGMLQQLHKEGHTVVLITHDNSIAVQAERIIRLEDGQVVYDGDAHAPEAVVQPTMSAESAQEAAK